MINDGKLNDLISYFVKRGGRIDKYYLREPNRGRRSLVYLKGWFSGQNVRSAILKAFGKV